MPALELSPLVVGILGVMAGVLVVAVFHCFKAWLQYEGGRRRSTPPAPFPASRGQNIRSHNQEDASSSNGSFSTVRLLIVSNYSKECKEETCSVCLSEFNEGDEVRVLPGCAHVFHVLCIDKWLLSHSNCPLCRADTFCSSRENVAGPLNSGRGMPTDIQGP